MSNDNIVIEMLIEGLHPSVYMLFFLASLVTLILGVSSRGWSSLIGFGLSLLFTVFCLYSAPLVHWDGIYYTGMFNLQIIFAALSIMNGLGIIYRLLISGGEE